MSQVRISESTHQILRSLSLDNGLSMQDIIEKAIEDYRRKVFLDGLGDDFRQLQQDQAEFAEHETEVAFWNNTLTDGLENE